jgi:hypothetical protein
VVAEALRERGLDEGAAWWAAERVRTLLDLPLPSALGGDEETLALRLVDAWLAHPAVRPFIRVNAWEGVEWFHRESWEELIAWTDRLEQILGPDGAAAGAASLSPSTLARVLEAAGAVSGYRVDRLREALGAGPEPEPVLLAATPKARSKGRAKAKSATQAPAELYIEAEEVVLSEDGQEIVVVDEVVLAADGEVLVEAVISDEITLAEPVSSAPGKTAKQGKTRKDSKSKKVAKPDKAKKSKKGK